MKKKVYNQPIVEECPLQPQSIICGSVIKGPDAPGGTIGD